MTYDDLAADLSRDLQTDGVCAYGTPLRRYDIEPVVLDRALKEIKAYFTVRNVEAVRGRRRTSRAYMFIHLQRKYLWSDPVVLAHLAGLAELRYRIGALPEDWFPVGARAEQYAGQNNRKRNRPDAYWRLKGKEYWVEYDRGTYTPLDRRLKIMAAAEVKTTLFWGDPSDARLVRVRREAGIYVMEENARQEALGARRRVSLTFHSVPTYWHVRSEVVFDDIDD